MDTTLNLPNSSAVMASSTSVVERAVTTKVAPIDANDKASTRPSEKPFVAQVVSARLSGTDFPENPSEIAPSERTLRPYDVPMLPSRDDAVPAENASDTGSEDAALDRP